MRGILQVTHTINMMEHKQIGAEQSAILIELKKQYMIRLYLNIYRQYMNTLDIDIYLASLY